MRLMDYSPLDRHEKVGLSYSGGKDSRACIQLLRNCLHEITIYHLDTGDLLPEMRENVSLVEAFAPRFVRIETNVTGWIAANGLPTDLMPYSHHPVGRLMGEAKSALSSRYDCCYANLMLPLLERMRADGITLIIRGSKRADMPRLPVMSGAVADGMELWLPVLDWTHQEVLDYLRSENVPLPRLYDHMTGSPDCARCSAWWSEGRAGYLKEYHPEIWAEYDARLQVIIDAIAPSLARLRREAGVT